MFSPIIPMVFPEEKYNFFPKSKPHLSIAQKNTNQIPDMYNGIGLQTPRGSGTSGYAQTNKFLAKPRPGKVGDTARKRVEGEWSTAEITKKPNKDILEHDRKRQIELKLAVLEDELIEHGYSDAEIAEKVQEARKTLQVAPATHEHHSHCSY